MAREDILHVTYPCTWRLPLHVAFTLCHLQRVLILVGWGTPLAGGPQVPLARAEGLARWLHYVKNRLV